MGILDNVFGRKILFTDEMNQFIETVKEIEWFHNCGKLYQKKLFYNYEMENKKNVSKKLNYIRNYKGFITLENFFITVDRRIINYLTENEKSYHWTWNKLADVINKRYMNNSNEINFIEIDNNYSKQFNLKKNKRIIYQIFRNTLFELFFMNYIQNLPLFYTNIFEIYKGGHIIIGWEGNEIEKDLWSKEMIKTTDGKIIIY